jgi:hypothetical protein
LLTKAIREVEAVVETMRAEHDPLASHIFVSRRHYQNSSPTKSGKRRAMSAQLSWTLFLPTVPNPANLANRSAFHPKLRSPARPDKTRRRRAASHLAVVFLSPLWRGFVSSLLCVLLGHVFALPRRAVKTRAFPMVNTCLGVNPYQPVTSARCGGIGRFLGRAPCGHRAGSRRRFPLSFRFLGGRFCFGRSGWRPGR